MSGGSAFIRSHDRIIIDTATSLHGAMMFEMNKGGPSTQQQYGNANGALSAMVRTLRDEKKKEIIILAQEKLILPNEDWVSEDVDEDTGVMTTVDLSPVQPALSFRCLMSLLACTLHMLTVRWLVGSG